jgi:cytochrome c553
MTELGRLLGFACLLPALSCGGAAPPAEPAPAPAAEAPTEPAGSSAEAAPAATAVAETAPAASVAWKDMTKDQRIEHMKNVVLPKMKESFAAFDAKHFGNMNCATCHGDGAKDGTFKMPSPKLPKLSVANGFKKHMDHAPEVTKFMMSKVLPEMAALLDAQPYDAKTNQGFGCAGCHELEK